MTDATETPTTVTAASTTFPTDAAIARLVQLGQDAQTVELLAVRVPGESADTYYLTNSHGAEPKRIVAEPNPLAVQLLSIADVIEFAQALKKQDLSPSIYYSHELITILWNTPDGRRRRADMPLPQTEQFALLHTLAIVPPLLVLTDIPVHFGTAK